MGLGTGHTSGQVSVVNQKHCVREMLEMPTRTPRALHIMRSVPGGSGTPSGKVATPLHPIKHISILKSCLVTAKACPFHRGADCAQVAGQDCPFLG